MKSKMVISFITFIMFGIILIFMYNEIPVNSVSSEGYSLTKEQKQSLQEEAYGNLPDPYKSRIINKVSPEVIFFKSGSNFYIDNVERMNIKQIHTILVRFQTSEHKFLDVYLDEKGSKMIGYKLEEK
ncbi:hypothetical protein [Bacillus testis]|uniref:hypothetical protein n=1 Tax=Bacillus testis TaxID=1622072 RepID=UPI000AFF476D|nr:hypothetical protein [Bacillus testis]